MTMKTYQTIIAGVLLMLCVNPIVHAQKIENLTDMNGRVWMVNTYAEIKGSPFLVENWVQGNVKFANGKVLNNIALKYDQIKDELLFKGKNNEDYYFSDPVKEFSLTYIDKDQEFNRKFSNGFPASKNLTDKSFYEIIVDGKVKLLKKNMKSITETKEFNSATVVKEVNENIGYYLAKGNELIPIKKMDVKTLANAIDAQKSSLIIDFSTKNNFSPKVEIDLKKIVTYANSIMN